MVGKSVREILTEVGFTENEAQVYLSLLALGQATSSALAKTSGIKRTTTYSVIAQLLQRNILRVKRLENEELYTAIGPDELLTKQYEIFKSLESRIPELMRFQKSETLKPSLEIHDGDSMMKEVHKILLSSTGEEILSLYNPAQSLLVQNEPLYFSFIRGRISSKIFQRSIIPPGSASETYQKADEYAFRATKISETLTLQLEIHLVDDKAIFIFGEGHFALVIRDRLISAALKNIYEVLWGASTSERAETTKVKSDEIAASKYLRVLKKIEAPLHSRKNLLEEDIEDILDDIRKGKREPKSTPIPIIKSDSSTREYSTIPVEKDLRKDKLVNALDYGLKGVSYYRYESEKDPTYLTNFKEAEEGVMILESLIPALKNVNTFLSDYGVELYMMDGFRTHTFQKKLWTNVHEQAYKFYSETSKQTSAEELSEQFTLKHISRPTKKLNAKDPTSWFAHCTGGSVVMSLVSKRGHLQELGGAFHDVSQTGQTHFYEKHTPLNEIERLIQGNRRLLFWALLTQDWINFPQNYFHFDICGEAKTQLGIYCANLWGLREQESKANLGPAKL